MDNISTTGQIASPTDQQGSHQPIQTEAGLQVDSRSLFQNGQRQVNIIHGDARYFLRLTRENKLILTK